MEGYEPKHPQYAGLPSVPPLRNCLGMRFFPCSRDQDVHFNLFRHFLRVKPHTTKIPVEYKKGSVLLSVSELPLLVEKRTEVKS
ncbi:cytochrome P450 3A24 [Trichonephila inaurata madagascariensis]|uniref:Cytochrome P450 3A24 n=1 Tax=Trichonephila inaurata madagascariensis TaxID=2747483 RepID=A0A8X6WXY1_9ARAC|nr:cytochrome P450 3A24 [Trichonephila inaurata madagascariensis]